MRALSVSLLMLLALPATAQESPETAEEQDLAEPDIVEPSRPRLPTDKELTQHIQPLQGQLSSQPRVAMLGAESLVADAQLAYVHGHAWALIAEALETQGYQWAAQNARVRAVQSNPQALDLAQAFRAAESLEDRRPLEEALAGVALDQDRVALYAARRALRDARYEEGLAATRIISKNSEVFADARLVEGALKSQLRDHSGALASFATAQARAGERSPDWHQALDLNLARTYFALGNQPKALVHYAKVDRGASNWVQVHFETAWSHFRMGDMAGSLSAIQSIQSPFFEQGYWAESELLAAYALFYMCKFPEARERITSFETRWSGVLDELAGLEQVTAQQAWEDRNRLVAGESLSWLPAEAVDRATWDGRASAAAARLDAMQTEIDRLRANDLPMAAERLAAAHAELLATEGERVLDQARLVRDELTSMFADLQITNLDLLDLEKRLYQAASNSGELGMGDPIGNVRELRRQQDARVWPYQGEYWADEVGYFRVTARSDCPASMQIGQR